MEYNPGGPKTLRNYIFTLPPELAASLALRTVQLDAPAPSADEATAARELAAQDEQLQQGGAFFCALTGASFADLQALREHYRTDWYRYNVKLKLQGKPTGVTEQQFDALVDNLTESISGSESSSSASDSDDASASSTDNISRLLRKQTVAKNGATQDEDEDEAVGGRNFAARSGVLWFASPQVANTQVGVYRASFPRAGSKKSTATSEEIEAELREIQIPQPLKPGTTKRYWTLMMFGGGHFAGAIFELEPRLSSRGKGKEKERDAVAVERKTFHRYTTRRKQGGAQSTKDNAGGKAKSGGATIRRHNEAALQQEVRELLGDWKELLDQSEVILLRANKTYHKTFFGYEEAVLQRGDPRIRGFPMTTRRPTHAELLRIFHEMTSVKVSNLTPEALAEMDAAHLESIKPARTLAAPAAPQAAPVKVEVPRMSKDEMAERDRWRRVVDMVKKGKIEALQSFVKKHGALLKPEGAEFWGKLPRWMDEARLQPTLLHVASAADQADLVRYLLETVRASPLVSSGASLSADGSETKTAQAPYELAPSRATRNVFRQAVADHPDWYNWTGSGLDGARVPSALDAEKEEERENKARERRDKMREKQRERDKLTKAKQEADDEAAAALAPASAPIQQQQAKAKTGPQRLGGAPPLKMLQAMGEGAGLSQEAKMRLEREKRARAAEARLSGR